MTRSLLALLVAFTAACAAAKGISTGPAPRTATSTATPVAPTDGARAAAAPEPAVEPPNAFLLGLMPLKSYLGELDPAGHVLQATILALADELASAAEPVMGKLDRIPVVIIRGLDWEAGEVGSQPLIRDPDRDLFR